MPNDNFYTNSRANLYVQISSRRSMGTKALANPPPSCALVAVLFIEIRPQKIYLYPSLIVVQISWSIHHRKPIMA